ncbi:MAG: aminotransferase class IV [Cyanobacteria bacterium]|nr:aminotransferase class IV [Cyanobacteriota bacterium]
MNYWYNGAPGEGDTIPILLNDPALSYGATVFTTLRVYDLRLDHPGTAWAAHCDRLRQSLQTFPWVEPDWGRLQQGASLMAQRYPVLRMALFPDGREWITGRELPADLEQRQTQGIIAWVDETGDYGRSLPAHKTSNYLGCWLALQAAQRQGAQEAILTNGQRWLETSTGNLWGWCDGQWYTPPLKAGILPGVARSRIIAFQNAIGIPVNEQPWTPALVSQFTSLTYTNSVIQAAPIRRILRSPSPVDYNPDQALLTYLRRIISGEMPGF